MRRIYHKAKDRLQEKSPRLYKHLDKRKLYIKYLIAGITAAFVNLSVLYFLTDILGFWYIFSTTISFICAFFVSFYLQKFWTFRDDNKEKERKQAVVYLCVSIGNLFLNAVGMYFLVDFLNIWYMFAQIIAGMFVAISSFIIYKFIIFKKVKYSNSDGRKILIATGIYPPDIGGPATYVKNLAQELSLIGCEIKILAYGDTDDFSQKNIFRVSRRKNLFRRYLKYLLEIIRLRKEFNFIYAHDLISVGIPCAFFTILYPSKKLIIRLGGDFLWEKSYNKGWTSQPLRSYYKEKKNIKEKIYLLAYRFVLSRCEKVIFSTNWQRDIFIKNLNVNQSKTLVIENYFPETKKFENNCRFLEKDILFAGRFVKIKNLTRMLDALKNIEVKIVLFGDGPEKENLICLANSQKTMAKIEIKEKLPHAELMKKICQSYLVIIPSITEISPNTVLECIKLGVPVILTKECGFYEKYKDDLIFFNPFDENEIRSKVDYLLREGNYKKYKEKISKINSSRSRQDVSREHHDLFIKL